MNMPTEIKTILINMFIRNQILVKKSLILRKNNKGSCLPNQLKMTRNLLLIIEIQTSITLIKKINKMNRIDGTNKSEIES